MSEEANPIYAAALAQGQEARGTLKHVEVEQWQLPDGTPAKVYFFEGLNMGELVAISEYLKPDGTMTAAGLFEVARQLFRDERGVQLFAAPAAWKQVREKYDPIVLIDILNRTGLAQQYMEAVEFDAKKQ